MPKSPQDIYARHLLSPRGYPLWTPEVSHQMLAYRRDGLRIGDVGVVIPEDGCFDIFFNLCLPEDHPFHRATGVPDNFNHVELTDMDIRTIINAENPGSIVANSSVKTIRTMERTQDTSLRSRSSGLEYDFNLSSSEGALLILPEGAERHDLRNHHRFLEAATQHGADWYRFAEEKVGQIINNDSLYLITGLYKSHSWSLAAFEETSEDGEYPAQFRISQVGGGNIAATGNWDTTRSLSWRVGPIDNLGIPNQSVFIRGFKIAHRTSMFGTKWISVKADSPSTRPNNVQSSGAVPGDSWLGYFFGGLSIGKTPGSSGSGAQDEISANPALDAARNEIQNNGALAVGEHVVVQRIQEASQAFHPSDIINQYLLEKDSSANIAITHDNEWIALLEENLLRSEDLQQEGLLEMLVSQHYGIISKAGAVYLCRNDSERFGANNVEVKIEGREDDSEIPAVTAVEAIPSAGIGDGNTNNGNGNIRIGTTRTVSTGMSGVKRHGEYYLCDGNICFLVENTMFRLHRYFFERESQYFRAMLNPSTEQDGSPDGPYIIHDVKTDEFAQFVWLWYNPQYSFSRKGKDHWLTVLRLATQWQFPEVKNLAIRQLEMLELQPIEKIVIYTKYGVQPELLLPSYLTLCKNQKLPSPEEGKMLSIETMLKLASAREQILLSASESGCKSPTTATAPDNIAKEVIAKLFGLTHSSNDQGQGNDKAPGGAVDSGVNKHVNGRKSVTDLLGLPQNTHGPNATRLKSSKGLPRSTNRRV